MGISTYVPEGVLQKGEREVAYFQQVNRGREFFRIFGEPVTTVNTKRKLAFRQALTNLLPTDSFGIPRFHAVCILRCQ